MTVTQAKKTISAALEDLQKQGVWVRGIEVTWETEGQPRSDGEGIQTSVKCLVRLGADL